MVVDALDRPIVQPAFSRTFGRTIETPQPEALFKSTYIDADELGKKTGSPLILMAATLEGQGPTAKFVRKMLTPDILEGVESGEYVIFNKKEPWAKNQRLLILLGRDSRELGKNARDWSDSLLSWAVKFERERITEQLYDKGEQKKIARRLYEKYGFNIRIQHDYIIAQENDSLQFVRLLRHIPERWVMVAWRDLEEGLNFNAEYAYNWRKSLGDAFLDPVETYDGHWTVEKTTINGREARLIRGLWATKSPLGGGPFLTYAVEVPENGKMYLIDGAVFSPGSDKLPLLWQLDCICRTFSVD